MQSKNECHHCSGTGICKVGKAESNCCQCFGVGTNLPPYRKYDDDDTMTEIVTCSGCLKQLQLFDIEEDIEGDEMYVVSLNNGQGGEATYCKLCWEAKRAVQ